MRSLSQQRSWFAPEVVQTSAMDCGPAALKCLLEGFRIPVSYGRLREACQTDVDGTSIDTIETVACDLGLEAEQVMLAADRLTSLDAAFPMLVTVRQGAGPTHFVVVWNRIGPWLQVMDPAVGRRWLRAERFLQDVYAHEQSVPTIEWRNWAESDENIGALEAGLARLGASEQQAGRMIAEAIADPKWFSIAALEAGLRLATTMMAAGGIARGAAAVRLLEALVDETLANPDDIYTLVAADYWSVSPDPRSVEYGENRLILRGAVLIRVHARAARGATKLDDLSPELSAALREKPTHPLQALWRLLRGDGVTAPVAVAGALCVGASAVVVETLLFRGIFDLGSLLNLGQQRLAAVLALLLFMGLLFAFRLPIATESMRLGRRLDVRLRMALLSKLPRLNDRYFQSRPVSDMAERAHSLHMLRGVPALGIQSLQTCCELIFTLAGLAWIDVHSLPAAALVVGVAVLIPVLFQPVVNEADLRVRSHGSALNGVHLDALLGIAPIRVHGAQGAVRRMHEGLLVEWSRSMTRLAKLSITADAIQQIACLLLASLLIIWHFQRATGVSGADLLLVFWTLKLPAIGHALVTLSAQYPAQRNVLMRLVEPLTAPEEARPAHPESARLPLGPIGFSIRQGSVVAGGHSILRDLDLTIRPGEHVAIVGPSGAGKSSLVSLLLGWNRLASGQLVVNGRLLRAAEVEQLRVRTAWVDPGVQIWNRSLLDNLTFSAPDADLRHMATAISAADLRDVLQSLPGGLQAPLGEGGACISGGEGQRVRLARAMAQAKPDLVLLDEPFRGMAREQRRRLLTGARQLWRGATLLCVSHDIAETQDFDRVLVIEGGQIVEDDAPARLLEAPSSRYRDLLDAECAAQDGLWTGHAWRHLRIEDGHVADVS